MDQIINPAADGGQHDSRGAFSISGEKAMEKLAAHTVSEPGEWILKMVQAAVAGEATQLNISQGRNEVTVRFDLASAPSPEEVRDAVLSTDSPSSPFLGELVIGLRSLLDREFSLHWPGLSGSLHWDGKVMSNGSEAAQKTPLKLVVAYSGWWLSSNGKERAVESNLLNTRAACCPIPLFLDKREITVVDQPPRSEVKKHSNFSPRHFAAGYLHPEQGEGEVAEATRWRDPMNSKDPITRWVRRPGVTGSFSLVLAHSKEAGYGDDAFEILWTRYGVVTARHKLSRALSGFLQLSGDHLRSDLGGLSSHLDESDIEEGIAQLKSLRRVGMAAHQHYAHFDTKFTYAQIAGIAGAVAVGAVLVVGSIASSVSSPSVADGGGGGWGSGSDQKETDSEVPKVFRRRLLELISEPPEEEPEEPASEKAEEMDPALVQPVNTGEADVSATEPEKPVSAG